MQIPEQIAAGDSPVARLYATHAPALFAYLRQRTAAREDAQDILSQIFVAAIEQGLPAGLSEREQAAWLWRVAHHKAVDAYRRSRLRQGVDMAQFTDLLYNEDEQHAPGQVSLKHEVYARLHTQLPDSHQSSRRRCVCALPAGCAARRLPQSWANARARSTFYAGCISKTREESANDTRVATFHTRTG